MGVHLTTELSKSQWCNYYNIGLTPSRYDFDPGSRRECKGFSFFLPYFFSCFFSGGWGWRGRELDEERVKLGRNNTPPPPAPFRSAVQKKRTPRLYRGDNQFSTSSQTCGLYHGEFFCFVFFPGSYCRVEMIPSFSEDRGIRTPGPSRYAADEEVNLQYTRVLVRGSATFVNSHSIAPLTGF